MEQYGPGTRHRPIHLLELLTALKSDRGDGVALLGGTAGDDDSIRQLVKDGYLPGEIPLAAENKSQVSGLAVFRGAELAGVLDSQEAQVYSLLTGGGGKKLVRLPDPLAPEFDIVVELSPGGRTQIHSGFVKGVPVFTIETELKGDIECIQSQTDYTLPENFEALTAQIQSVCKESMMRLIAKTQKELKADILKLGDKLAYHFATVGAWERYHWPEQLQNAEIEVDLRVKIERTGLMTP